MPIKCLYISNSAGGSLHAPCSTLYGIAVYIPNFNLSYHMQVKVEEEEFVTGSIFQPNKRKISIAFMTKLQFVPRINSQMMAPVLETVVSRNIFFNPTTHAYQIIVQVKAKLLLKRSNNRGPKWQWSTQQASSMHLIHGTSLYSVILDMYFRSI